MANQVIPNSPAHRFTGSVVARKAGCSMKWSCLGWKGNELTCRFLDQSGMLDPLKEVQILQLLLTSVFGLSFRLSIIG